MACGSCGERPGFWQRCIGVLSGYGGTIEGARERSDEGSQWKHDLT